MALEQMALALSTHPACWILLVCIVVAALLSSFLSAWPCWFCSLPCKSATVSYQYTAEPRRDEIVCLRNLAGRCAWFVCLVCTGSLYCVLLMRLAVCSENYTSLTCMYLTVCYCQGRRSRFLLYSSWSDNEGNPQKKGFRRLKYLKYLKFFMLSKNTTIQYSVLFISTDSSLQILKVCI